MAIQIHPILNFGRFFSAVNDEERDAGSCDPDNVNPISLADIAKIYGTRSIICAQVRKRRGQYLRGAGMASLRWLAAKRWLSRMFASLER